MNEAATKTENQALAKQSRAQQIVIVAAVLIATLATYIGTLWYSFVYDDDGIIVSNSYIQYWRHVPRYFISQVWAQLFPRAGGTITGRCFFCGCALTTLCSDCVRWAGTRRRLRCICWSRSWCISSRER
jgi:hypothetical protein